MEVDKIITLKNGENYLLLMENDFTEKDYYLAVLLDEKEQPTKQYEILDAKRRERDADPCRGR